MTRRPAPLLVLCAAGVGLGGEQPRVTLAAPTIVHLLAVTVARGEVFVADGANGRIVRLGRRGAVVHATGLVEPTGLAAAPGRELYAADFTAGVVLRIGRDGRSGSRRPYAP